MQRLIYSIFIVLLAATLSAQKHLDLIHQGAEFQAITDSMERLRDANSLDEKRHYKQYKRWQMTQEARRNTAGQAFNFAAQTWKEYHIYKRSHSEPADQRVTNGIWTPVTPTAFSPNHPNNGRVNVIAVHPIDDNIVYVGAAVGGLWKSSNAGATWTCLTDGLPVIGISGIAIHPTTPNTMYILTGDGDGRDIPSIGVLKSSNGGNSWEPTSLMFSVDELIYGYKLAIDPTNPNRMYAVTNAGVYSTSDSWTTAPDLDLAGVSLRDIEFRPGSGDTIYISSFNQVYRSIDGGSSWSNLSVAGNGLLNDSSLTRIALAVTPADPDHVWALHAKNVAGNGFIGLYWSITGGAAWTMVADTPNIVGRDDYNQVGYDLEIVADPDNTSNLLVGGIDLYESASFGTFWGFVPNETDLHDDIHNLLYTTNYIYVAHDGGMSKSTDNGMTWTDISEGLDIAQFYDIDVLSSDLIGGTQDNGTSLWTVGDASATRAIGADGFECIFDPTNTNVVYGCTQNVRQKSTSGGANGSFNTIHPPGHGATWDASWIMHPTDYDTLYSAFNDIARTYNAGSSWTFVDPFFVTNGTIRAMAQGVDDPGRLYCSNRRELRTTPDIHATPPGWVNLTFNLPFTLGNSLLIGGLTVDPANSDRIWLTLLNYSDGEKVFRSDNAGYSWTNISGTLPNVPASVIIYEPGSNDGLYVGTDVGVFYRNNAMTDWIYFSNGLPTTRIDDLNIESGYIYAGTYGRSVWRSQVYTSCPSDYMLTQANDPSSATSTGTQHYEASSAIVSTRIVTGGIGTDVIYRAGDYVRLDPGFEARAQNAFEAKLGGCSQ